VNWTATARWVSDERRPLGQRVTALHSLLANHHAPLGFEATRQRLLAEAGVAGKEWTAEQVMAALRSLTESRKSHLRYREAFAARRQAEKAQGRRQPTKRDIQALDAKDWLRDADAAARRQPSRKETADAARAPDETLVERLTLVSEVGWLHFEPAVVLRPGERFWVNDRTLHIRAVDGTVRHVPARPSRPGDAR
jgi:hypothetical protein